MAKEEEEKSMTRKIKQAWLAERRERDNKSRLAFLFLMCKRTAEINARDNWNYKYLKAHPWFC